MKTRALERITNFADVAVGMTSIAESLRAIDSPFQRMLEEQERHQEMMRRVFGPLNRLQHTEMFPSLSAEMELIKTSRAFDQLHKQFQVPKFPPEGLLRVAQETTVVSDALKRYAQEEQSLRKAMEAMHEPWLNIQDQAKSISSFARIQGIGSALSDWPTFDDRLIGALRTDLGDWRSQIDWPKSIFADTVARRDFYTSLGFDHSLTEFPRPAFRQSLELGGLLPVLPARAHLPGEQRSDEDIDGNEQDENLARNNCAHDSLQWLETQLREFINEMMTAEFGPNWPLHGLPNGLYGDWLTKKKIAEKEGRDGWPIIYFADFRDYEKIICKRDNWRRVFGASFGRRESVRESFQRLYPVRVDTMHARPITQDDELLLVVEVRRLLKAITTSD